jgi:hypothetical protein
VQPLSIREVEPPPKTRAEELTKKAGETTPQLTLLSAVAFTGWMIGQAPLNHPWFPYVGWGLACPAVWLLCIGSRPSVREAYEGFNATKDPIRGVVYVSALAALMAYLWVFFFVILPPIARQPLTGFHSATQPPEETIAVAAMGPRPPAPPMPSALLPPTQSKAYRDLQAQLESERAARIRAEQRAARTPAPPAGRGSTSTPSSTPPPTRTDATPVAAATPEPPPTLVRPNLPAGTTNPCLAGRNVTNLRQLEQALDEAFRLRQEYVSSRGDEVSTRSMIDFGNSNMRSILQTSIGAACVPPYERVAPLTGPLDQVPQGFPVEKEGSLRKFDAQTAHLQTVINVLRAQQNK